ncbi:MarR family winged helix-turn-helix transcriptional regulator [Entomomonas asaccharolytica]|uniref:MarR family transcriptional regulator n=1 Tax=Entomomonas asaccharolytica TaxID=2785331 RepID=A0A974NI87_9GAMM|nr:MarR family transcriptional regulator [Entomomonas asaccharolytica]QQP86979.1 MarR family transcriptional regulator [Entomomonas asaccharolytica]
MYFTPETIIEGSTLGQLLHFANNCKDKIIDQYTAAYDLTSAQFKALLCIAFRNMTTPAVLSQALRIDNGAVTRLLDRLEKKGLLQRVRDEQDRRQINIVLTTQGIAISKKIPAIVADSLNQLTLSLTNNEVEQLQALLKKMLLANGYQATDFILNKID